MKAVMLSLRPQWAEKIFNGSKTIEVRKSYPSIPTPFKVYVYETKGATDTPWVDEDGHFIYKGRGEIIGSFVCDRITCCQAYYGESGEKHLTNLFGCDVKNTCLTEHEMFDYIIGKDKKEGTGWLWHITEPKLFDKPRELCEFYAPCRKGKETADESCKGCSYAFKGVSTGEIICDNAITRPPQSFCYIEVDE